MTCAAVADALDCDAWASAATPRSLPAAARSTSPSAPAAGSPSGAARATADDAAPAPTPPRTLAASTPSRPRTWGDCQRDGWAEGPCPWVGCRHHLALDVMHDARRGDGLRVHGVAGERAQPRVLRPRTAAEIEQLAELVVARIATMPATCSLAVAASGPTAAALPIVLGVSARKARGQVRRAAAAARARGVALARATAIPARKHAESRRVAVVSQVAETTEITQGKRDSTPALNTRRTRSPNRAETSPHVAPTDENAGGAA